MPVPMQPALNESDPARHLLHGALLSDAIASHLADMHRLQAQVRQIDQNAARRRKRLVKLAADLKGVDDAARHEARIAAKKLRYAAEAFAPLFDADAKPFIKSIKQLQEELGALNDAAVASELVARLRLKGAALAAAKTLLAAREAARPKSMKGAVKAMDRLVASPPFWII